jgi:hypothetical protein
MLAALLTHMCAPVQAGKSTGLLLAGFDGAGRSALLRQAYDKAGQETRTIYQIGPDPSGLAAPYYPIRSLLAAVLQLPPVSSDVDLRDAVLSIGLNERDIPGIAQLFGHPTTLLELEPPVRRREMVWSTLRALERAAAQGPVTVVCEDIDRFDHPTLEILRRANETTELALPPIVMTSTTAFAEQWPSGVPRLEIGALDAHHLGELVDLLTESGVRGLPTSQVLFEITRAYPGHLEHVVRYLLEGGKAEDLNISLPDLVAARLSMLKQATRDVLQAAAVLGLEPQVDLLRTMLSRDVALEAAMADAERSGLLGYDPSGELLFTSRLVRDIVYDATPADVRRSLHAAAALAVESISPDIALLGHHHDLAGHAKDAIPLLRRAGDHAAEQLDDVGAGQYYQRALVAVRQAVQSGEDEKAEGQFVQLSVRLADVLRLRGETALARGVLAEARDWSGVPHLVSMIDRASAAIGLTEGDLYGAITALRRGVGRAIATGDMNLVCELYLDLSTALLRSGDPTPRSEPSMHRSRDARRGLFGDRRSRELLADPHGASADDRSRRRFLQGTATRRGRAVPRATREVTARRCARAAAARAAVRKSRSGRQGGTLPPASHPGDAQPRRPPGNRRAVARRYAGARDRGLVADQRCDATDQRDRLDRRPRAREAQVEPATEQVEGKLKGQVNGEPHGRA